MTLPVHGRIRVLFLLYVCNFVGVYHRYFFVPCFLEEGNNVLLILKQQ